MSNLEQILKPALDAYGEELRAHGHDYAGWPTRRCLCGWEPHRQSKQAGRAVGLHVTAAHKRASKTYDIESAKLLAAHPIAGAPSPF